MEIRNPKEWVEEVRRASATRDSEKLYQLRQDIIWETKAISDCGKYEVNGNTVKLDKPPRSTAYTAEIHLTENDTEDASGPTKFL